MNLPMLVVDRNVEFSLSIQSEWLKRGISTVRVDTMQEAIDKLTKESYLFVAINADNTNYVPMLRIISDISPVPVFIITSNFSMRHQTEAFRLGADGYVLFLEDINETIDLAMALLHRCHERGRKLRNQPDTLIYKNLLVIPSFRKVFYCDSEIVLTNKEFSILCFLMKRPGHVFSYEQIYGHIWGEEYTDNSKETLWNIISRLRNKLQISAEQPIYIRTLYGDGYSFDPQYDNN